MFKILSNTRYKQLVNLISELNNEIIELNKIKKEEDKKHKLEKNELIKKTIKLDELLADKKTELEEMTKKVTILNGTKGGYTKEKNKLKNIIFGLEVKNREISQEYEEKVKQYEETIADLKSDRYLVKKIPSGRPPKSQIMKIKHEKGSEVARKFLSYYE